MLPFSYNLGKYWVIGNENSREKLQNLGIPHDFKEISIGNGVCIRPL